MPKYIKLVLSLFYIFIISQSLSAQSGYYKFRTFSPDGGFYYDGVKSIRQDINGFIWAVMDNDLYRFDGYEYKRYYSYFRDLDTSNRCYFHNIITDCSGRLLVTTNNGVHMYNKESDTFSQILDSATHLIDAKLPDKLLMIENSILKEYDTQTGKYITAQYMGEPLTEVSTCYRSDSFIFVVTHKGTIYKSDYTLNNTSEFIQFDLQEPIRSIKETNGELWVLADSRILYKIDIQTKKIEDKIDFFEIQGNDKFLIKTFLIDKNKQIWVGSQQGLYIINPQSKEYRLYLHSNLDPFSIPNNSIWTIAEDNDKNIWIGTFSGGLSYINLDEQNLFNNYTQQNGQINHNLVSGFAEDSNHLWIATEGGGINRMDKNTKDFTYFTSTTDKNSLAYNNIKSLAFDESNNNLWIAMFRGGLDCFDPQTNQFKHFKRSLNNTNSLVTNDLRKIVLENNSGLWIAYQLEKLVISYFSFQDQSFTHYYFDFEDSNYFIFDIYKGVNDDLWIVSHKKLYRMDTKKRSIGVVPVDRSIFLNAQSIWADSNNVWIGTIGNGLIKYDTKTKETTKQDLLSRFNASSIYSLCSDDKDNLWMGTDNGLFRFNKDEDQLLRFDKKDGIQGQVYYPLSSFKGRDGSLYFGGTNGFTKVNSNEITSNTTKPQVIISEFLIDNKTTSTNTDSDISKIILDHNQTNFGFKFSCNNYLIPEKNRYRFRLVGYDDRWQEVDASNRSALYSKVPPGEYTFEIFAANNDGIWSDTPTVIRIKRLPAPWLSWWAYSIYFAILALILYYIIREYNNKKKLKVQLYLDNIEQKKKEEVHQSQLVFFTNISHDFKTPLSLILAALEKMRQEGLQEYYYRLLNNNTKRLLNLVNELMDFRTVANGKMDLRLQPVNLNYFIEELASDFVDYAQQRNITYDITYDNSLPPTLYIDKYIMEKVVMNLLNNAFKYTKDGGHIRIGTFSDENLIPSMFDNSYTISNTKDLTDTFSIVVKDSGIGISKESIKNVFERFYKVKTPNTSAHLGTGIGLALVKSLVLLHKGSISIYSEREKGTDIIVSFSSNSNLYDEKDFIQEETSTKNNIYTDVEVPDPINNNKEDNEELLKRSKKRLLLVEDNTNLRSLIANYLSPYYDIVEATNGREAIELLDKKEIDLIISDIMMPKVDGITLCRKVKQDINTSHIPFVLLTAKTGLDSKIEGIDAGADIYFEKPVDLSLLKLTLHNFITRQQQLKEYYAKNYFADSSELSDNQQDNQFLTQFIRIIERNLDQPQMDINFIASELSMSRSKLYTKIKSMTDKSIVEFVLNYRLREAAKLIIEQNLSMHDVMMQIGIESQSYFTRSFKKEFGETPTAFASKYKKEKPLNSKDH